MQRQSFQPGRSAGTAVCGAGVGKVTGCARLHHITHWRLLSFAGVLCLPALDGGRWTVMTLFRIFKKDLTKEREETIQSIGFLAIILLTILVTWSDVSKLFG